MKAQLAQTWAGFWEQRTDREKMLLTWGGVFCYLLRVERLTREVERKLGNITTESTEDSEKI